MKFTNLFSWFGYDIRGVFFETRKVFDKIQYNCVVFKLEQNAIWQFAYDFTGQLDELREVVVLNSRVYSWTSVTARVHLGQSLVQCSFSSTQIMIYRKISIDGTHSHII